MTTKMYVNREDRRSKFWVVVRIITVLVCLGAFVWNSYLILLQFFNGATITSNDINHCQKYDCLMPSITMCGLQGFKKKMSNFTDLELDNYLNRTVELSEMLSYIYAPDNVNYLQPSTLGNHIFNESLWELSTTYSEYRGRCYTIDYKKSASVHSFVISMAFSITEFSAQTFAILCRARNFTFTSTIVREFI